MTNQEAIDRLICVMVQSMSKKLLNEKWGSECNVEKLDKEVRTASALLWLLEKDCEDTVDINILSNVEKFLNTPLQTAYQCETVECEEKIKTVPCAGVTVTEVVQTPCSFLVEDVST